MLPHRRPPRGRRAPERAVRDAGARADGGDREAGHAGSHLGGGGVRVCDEVGVQGVQEAEERADLGQQVLGAGEGPLSSQIPHHDPGGVPPRARQPRRAQQGGQGDLPVQTHHSELAESASGSMERVEDQ